MSEREFERMLELVDALDPIQLLRLQCKVSALIGDPPTGVLGPGEGTIPPPPPGGSEGEYEDLRIDFDDDPTGR